MADLADAPVTTLKYSALSSDRLSVYSASASNTDFYRYDIASNTWSALSPLPVSGTENSIIGAISNGILFVPDASSPTSIVHYYNPNTGGWTVNLSLRIPGAGLTGEGLFCRWSSVFQTNQWSSLRTFAVIAEANYQVFFNNQYLTSIHSVFAELTLNASTYTIDVERSGYIEQGISGSIFGANSIYVASVLSAGSSEGRINCLFQRSDSSTCFTTGMTDVDNSTSVLGRQTDPSFTSVGKYDRMAHRPNGESYLIRENTNEVWKYIPRDLAGGSPSLTDVSGSFPSITRLRPIVINNNSGNAYYNITANDLQNELFLPVQHNVSLDGGVEASSSLAFGRIFDMSFSSTVQVSSSDAGLNNYDITFPSSVSASADLSIIGGTNFFDGSVSADGTLTSEMISQRLSNLGFLSYIRTQAVDRA